MIAKCMHKLFKSLQYHFVYLNVLWFHLVKLYHIFVYVLQTELVIRYHICSLFGSDFYLAIFGTSAKFK